MVGAPFTCRCACAGAEISIRRNTTAGHALRGTLGSGVSGPRARPTRLVTMSKKLLVLSLLAVGLALGLFVLSGERAGGTRALPDRSTTEPVRPTAARASRLAGDAVEADTSGARSVPGAVTVATGVRLAGGGRLAGRVLERESGAALAGLEVGLWELPPAGGPVLGAIARLVPEVHGFATASEPLATTESDASGAFGFEGVRPGTWFVQARGSHHVPDGVVRALVASTGEGGPLDLFVRAGGRVLGVVERPDGRPAVSADVTLITSFPYLLESLRRGELCFRRTTTDGQGRFAIPGVPPGPGYDVYAEGGGFALSFVLDQPVRAGEDTEVTVPTRAGGRIAGRVVSTGDTETAGEPVAGAHVAAVPQGLRYLPFAPSVLLATRTTTDANGSYVLRDVPPGEVDVVGFAPGHVAALGPSTLVPEAGSVAVEDFELVAGPTVSGRVVDGAGTPLAGVRVSWTPIDLSETGLGSMLAPLVVRGARALELPRTGADGRFEAGAFPGEPPYWIDFEKEGYAHVRHAWKPDEEDTLEIVLSNGGWIEGIVMDGTAFEPVEAFTVKSDELLGSGMDAVDEGPFGGVFVEAEEGRFRVGPFEPGSVRLEVDAPGYLRTRSEDIQVVAGETARGVILELFPGGTVRGRVFDEDGESVAGAVVFPRYEEAGENPAPSDWTKRRGDPRARDADSPPGLASYLGQLGLGSSSSTLTDADGAFELTGMEPGVHRVVAVHRDYASSWSPPFELLNQGEVLDVVIVLERGGAVFGEVSDRFGDPVPDAIVVAVAPNNFENEDNRGDALFQGVSDDEGAYRIEHVAAGTYFLLLARGDEALHPMSFLGTLNFDMVTVPEGEAVRYDITDNAAGGTRVFGRIDAGDVEVTGGQITALGFGGDSLLGVDVKVARIQAGGSYEFEELAPGDYRFEIKGQGLDRDVRMTVEIPDVTEYRLDLPLPSGRISGRVLDASNGEAIARAQVTIRSSSALKPQGLLGGLFAGEAGRQRDWADDDGRFSFTRLEAADYELAVLNARGKENQVYAPTDPVTVELGSNQERTDIVLQLEPALKLQGVVVDPDQEPVPGVRVSVWIEGRIETLERARETDAQGRFHVDGLAPGTYVVSAAHTAWATVRVPEVVLSRSKHEPLKIELVAGVAVSVLVLAPDGLPVSGASARLVTRDGEADPGDMAALFEGIFQGSGVSGADGLLDLGRYLPGDYTLEAQRGSARSNPVEVRLRAGDTSERLTVRLR